nr:hypothetical protein [Tanacetum cinerariifolium]
HFEIVDIEKVAVHSSLQLVSTGYLFRSSIRIDDSNQKDEDLILCAGNPIKEVLPKLNLPGHRIRRRRYNIILAKSKFKIPCSIIKDKYMMKAQWSFSYLVLLIYKVTPLDIRYSTATWGCYTAQSFSEEEWENIRARVKADEELTQRLQAEERNKYNEVDQAKMLVDLINKKIDILLHKKLKQRGYSFDKLKTLFETTLRRVNTFVPMETEDRGRASELAAGSSQETITDSAEVRISKKATKVELDYEGSKRQKTNEASGSEKPDEEENELSQEDLQQVMKVVLVEEVYVEALQDDLVMLWGLVKERFSLTEATYDKERTLWVELKRLFEPDTDEHHGNFRGKLVRTQTLDYLSSSELNLFFDQEDQYEEEVVGEMGEPTIEEYMCRC